MCVAAEIAGTVAFEAVAPTDRNTNEFILKQNKDSS
jgi:hypothetical protein